MRTTKFTLALVVIGLLLARLSFAQDDTAGYKHVEIGIGATGGASIFNGTVPDGSKTDIYLPAYLIQGSVIYSFHPLWGLGLGIGYESRGMVFREQNKTDPSSTITLNYLSFHPSLKFKQFLLGVTIGLPLSNSTKLTSATGASSTTSWSKDSMNTLFDIRIGAILPIYENDKGSFNFLINASWNISNAFNHGYPTPGQNFVTSPSLVTKSPIPTLQIGFSYLLAAGGKTHDMMK